MNHLTTQDAVETWKIAHRFVLDVYRLSSKLPAEEQHGLTAKLRTSSVKVASNIVEGHARKNSQGYATHLTESQAALEETKYSLLVARDLGYISEQSYDSVINDAEAISERLDRLQAQLSAPQQPEQTQVPAAAPAAPAIPAAATPQSKRPAAFGTKKSVRHTWSDLLGWFKGSKPEQITNERYDNVWTEESAVTSYLEEPQQTPRV